MSPRSPACRRIALRRSRPAPLRREPRPIKSSRRLRPTLPRSPIGWGRCRGRCLHGDAAERQSKMAAEPGGGRPWPYCRYRPLLAAFAAALLLLSPSSSSSCHHRVPSGEEVGPPREPLRRRGLRGEGSPVSRSRCEGSPGLSPHGCPGPRRAGCPPPFSAGV